MVIASIKIVLYVEKFDFGGLMLKSKQSENCVKIVVVVVEWLRAFKNDGILAGIIIECSMVYLCRLNV